MSIREDVVDLCASLSLDPMLVQGAGGNISWKDKDNLWIKASGTRLSDAKKTDIFVSVDLVKIKASLENEVFDCDPIMTSLSKLRPSIETVLHALLPNKIVVHLHAVHPVTILIQENAREHIEQCFNNVIDYAFVDYKKPGPELAQNVFFELNKNKKANVIFLENHGIVIGGNSIDDITQKLDLITNKLSRERCEDTPSNKNELESILGMEKLNNSKVQQLVENKSLFERLDKDWAICPDHIVFLGPIPHKFLSPQELTSNNSFQDAELVFIYNHGVYVGPGFSQDKIQQLEFFYEVVSRLADDETVKKLNPAQVSELVEWDAEKYRLKMTSEVIK